MGGQLVRYRARDAGLSVPSATRSPASISARYCGSDSRCWTRRQAAAMSSLNFRLLTLPRRNPSIAAGSVQASHSASVMASPLPQEQVHDPADPNVWAWLPTMPEDVWFVAASLFEGIGQHRQVREVPAVVHLLSHRDDKAVVPGQPGGSEGNGAERVADDVS